MGMRHRQRSVEEAPNVWVTETVSRKLAEVGDWRVYLQNALIKSVSGQTRTKICRYVLPSDINFNCEAELERRPFSYLTNPRHS